MSLDARAATLATGAGGHPGWAAKAQRGPLAAVRVDRTGAAGP